MQPSPQLTLERFHHYEEKLVPFCLYIYAKYKKQLIYRNLFQSHISGVSLFLVIKGSF